MRAAILVCFLLCAASTAEASRQLVFDVPEEGGIYEIPVHPQRLTVLYFAASVTGFVHGDAHGATFNHRQHIITVAIQPESPVITMSADCSLFRVGLLLRPVEDPDDAAVQVQFRDLSRREVIRAEVAKQMKLRRAEIDVERAKLEAERAEIERTRRALDRVIEERARMLVAAGMDKRLGIERVKATTRNRDHVIARIREIVWLGDDAYVRLSIQNRSDTPYRVMDVSLMADQIAYPVQLVMPGAGKERPQVRARGVGHGMFVIPGAVALGRETVEFALNKSTPGRAIRLRVVLQQ